MSSIRSELVEEIVAERGVNEGRGIEIIGRLRDERAYLAEEVEVLSVPEKG
jgi:hypothetical protein